MVALLVLHYRLLREFPSTIQCFYGDLFEVLFKRHDQTKGYRRVRRSDAAENELRDLFGYLCYVTRKKDAIEVQREEFLQFCEQGMRFYGRNFDTAGALDDIIKGTNLILEDGFNCRFAHKSIQEFYGARFLTAQTEEDVRKFLHARIKAWAPWRQFLEFTEILNKHLFCKHFLAPHIGWAALDDAAKQIETGWSPSIEALDKVFGDDVVSFRGMSIDAYLPKHESLFYPFQYLAKRPVWQLMDSLSRLEVDWIGIQPDPSSPALSSASAQEENAPERPPLISFTIAHLLRQPAVEGKVRKELVSAIAATVPVILSIYTFLDHRSRQTDLFG
jgi:hypothetical protein